WQDEGKGEAYDYGDEFLGIIQRMRRYKMDLFGGHRVGHRTPAGQELSEKDISELKEFAIAGGYIVDEEILGKNYQHFIKEKHITGSLFYSNFKLQHEDEDKKNEL
ncbi:hypothetical protein ACJX0J_016342, partial [Zea mays]